MEVEYQVQMVYEQEDVSGLVHALEYRQNPDTSSRNARKKMFPILGIILAIIGAGTLGSLLMIGMIDIVAILTSLICLLAGIVVLRRSDSKAMERRSWARYPNKGMTVTYTFFNDHFETDDEASGNNSFKYLTIRSANEDDNHFYLFTAANNAHILRKDRFIEGDPERFRKFIRIKSAITVDLVE